MADKDIELQEKQIIVEGQLRMCTAQQLRSIAVGIKIEEDKLRDYGKLRILREIQFVLDEILDQEEKSQLLILISNLFPKEMITIPSKLSLKDDGDISPGGGAKENGVEMTRRRQNMQDTLNILEKLGIDDLSSDKKGNGGTFWREKKDLKLNGTIGGSVAGQDDLNYISLCSQIKEARRKGYDDHEITSSIKKAVKPGTYLRTYLDSKADLTVDQTISFIRSYLKEKSPTELFQELNSIFQLETEDPQTFVLRALELREKILVSSHAEGSIRYDSELVQSLFLHTVRTGLDNPSIKARLEPLVRRGADTTDEQLIQELNLISSEETERDAKRGIQAAGRRVQIASMDASGCTNGNDGASRNNDLSDTVKQLVNTVEALRAEVVQIKEDRTNAPIRRSCRSCYARGQRAACRHCWKCGAGLTVDAGKSTVTKQEFPCCKNLCSQSDVKNDLKLCTGCKSVSYCSKQCQKKQWKSHRLICNAISHLESEKIKKSKDVCSFSTVDRKMRNKLVNLVGERCMMSMRLGNVDTRVLWDTGAQISLVSLNWLKDCVKDFQVGDVSEIIGRDIEVKGADGADIPYVGYTLLECVVGEKVIEVPFLVTKADIENPIVGYNVIEHVVKSEGDNLSSDKFSKNFPKLTEKNISAVLSLMQTQQSSRISKVKLHKFDALVRAGATISVPCRVDQVLFNRKTPVLFEPEVEDLLPEGLEVNSSLLTMKKGSSSRVFITVTNNTHNDIVIRGRQKLGDLYFVSSVTPANVKLEEPSNGPDANHSPRPAHATKDSEAGVNISSDMDKASRSANKDEERVAEEVTVSSVIHPDTTHDDEYKVQLQKIELPDDLTGEQKEIVRKMLWEERAAFAYNDDQIGCAEDLQMDISTTDEVPVQKRYNSIPRPLFDEVKCHVEDMLNRGWITKSTSAWSSPVVIVRKSCGGIRLCCDFRQLNQKSHPDKHPLPRVQESLDSLGGSSWFSVVDLTRAYYQGFVSPESRHKTAFVTPWGFYQWVRIPFGLMNAPAKFQRYMENVFSDLRDKCALPYLDDVIVFSKSFLKHVDHIRVVLRRIISHGLMLKASKCDFFKREVKFLGRIVNSEGYRMDTKNIQAVSAMKDIVPTDVSEVRQLLGLLGYHRRHIQHYSQIAKPLTDLLATSNKEDSSTQKEKRKLNKKKAITWSPACQQALCTLVDAITSAPLLVYADFNKDFILHTDASMKGLGAILYQKDENEQLRVIGYVSRTLHKAEANYHPTKLEFLALKWAVTEAFRDYLAYANHFLVLTDNNPLVYLMQARKLNAFADRWVSELAEYHFTIKYRPGVVNKDADCLSRLPLDINKLQEKCTEHIPPDAFQAIMAGMQVQSQGHETWRACVAAIDVSNNNVLDKKINIIKAQRKDEDLKEIISCLNRSPNEKPKCLESDSKQLRKLKLEYSKLALSENVLVRKLDTKQQIVLPRSLRDMVYQQLHVDMGHLGVERVTELARDRVYWPGMQADIDHFIHKRCLCLKQQRPQRHVSAPLKSVITSMPMELVSVDFLKLEKGSGGNEYILLIVDQFTKYAQAYPTRNKSSVTAAKKLYNDFILRFGIPAKIVSDQGGEFENKLIADLNRISGITKLRTTPYHPQSNGMCERMNRTLLQMLRTLPENKKKNWPSMVNKMTHAYNCTTHSSTGFSPYRLLFGREPRLPIDLLMDSGRQDNEKSVSTYSKFAEEWKDQMEEAYKIARNNSSKSQIRNQKRWNARPLLTTLQKGDRVLIQNKAKGGPGKLRSFWEQDVYTVIEKMGDLEVVYAIQKENDPKSKRRVVHRNMLLAVDDSFDTPSLTLNNSDNHSSRRPTQVAKEHEMVVDELFGIQQQSAQTSLSTSMPSNVNQKSVPPQSNETHLADGDSDSSDDEYILTPSQVHRYGNDLQAERTRYLQQSRRKESFTQDTVVVDDDEDDGEIFTQNDMIESVEDAGNCVEDDLAEPVVVEPEHTVVDSGEADESEVLLEPEVVLEPEQLAYSVVSDQEVVIEPEVSFDHRLSTKQAVERVAGQKVQKYLRMREELTNQCESSHENTPASNDLEQPRRSGRVTQRPNQLTYTEMGNPTINAVYWWRPQSYGHYWKPSGSHNDNWRDRS